MLGRIRRLWRQNTALARQSRVDSLRLAGVAIVLVAVFIALPREEQRPEANRKRDSPTESSARTTTEQQPASNQQASSTNQQPSYGEKWIDPQVVTNILLAVIGVFAIRTAVRSLQAMKLQSIAAKRAANAAKASADIQVQQLRMLHEPMVELANPQSEPLGRPHTLIAVTWQIVNAGMAPVRVQHLDGCARPFRGPYKDKPDTTRWGLAEPVMNRIIPIGESIEYTVYSDNLTAEEIMRFDKNHLNLSVQIEVTCIHPFAVRNWPAHFVFRRIMSVGRTSAPEQQWFAKDAENWPKPHYIPCTIYYQSSA